MSKERIEWTRSTGLGQSGWKGRVNGLRLFGIERSMVRGVGWQLRTSLPVALTRALSTGASEDVLMANAENILDLFARKLGASWPGDRTEEV